MAGIKALVIGMGVLILAGFVVVVVTLINRASPGADGAPMTAEARLQPGEKLVRASLDGSRVLLHIETATGGARLEVRNLGDGALLGTVDVKAATP